MIEAARTPVEFYYGFGSRYSYLASTQINTLERDCGCSVQWIPIVSQDLMARRGQNPFSTRDDAGRWSGASVSATYTEAYRQADLKRWAAYYGVSYREPVQPRMEAKRRTLYCVAASLIGAGASYSCEMMRAIFADGRAISDDDCRELAEGIGIDGAQLRQIVDDGRALAAHEASIDRALKLDVFGVPTFVANNQLYFGNDRIVLLRAALMAKRV